MKQVVLQRAWSDERATLGMLRILGTKHNPIFTLENPLRTTTKDSRIPSGEYICEPYSGTKYKGVYLLKDVPGREAILIHWGNFERDTEGCILVGQGAGMLSGEPAITASKAAFAQLRELLGGEQFCLLVMECHND